MLVVSDTSPISALLQIGRAELLGDLFGRVCVPEAVGNELARVHTTLASGIRGKEANPRDYQQVGKQRTRSLCI